jgi:hypothetical protein
VERKQEGVFSALQHLRIQPARSLAVSFYAATSMRNVIWGMIEPWLQCASRAPGTIRQKYPLNQLDAFTRSE